jgi:hypothetical protein
MNTSDKPQLHKHKHSVSGSAFISGLPCLKTPNCLRCNNTGCILPCNDKLVVMVDSCTLEGRYDNIKESENMIKCDCGR